MPIGISLVLWSCSLSTASRQISKHPAVGIAMRSLLCFPLLKFQLSPFFPCGGAFVVFVVFLCCVCCFCCLLLLLFIVFVVCFFAAAAAEEEEEDEQDEQDEQDE